MRGIILSALLVVASAGPATLPPDWKQCRRSLPNHEIQRCMQTVGEHVMQDLSQRGLPSLNIDPLDPLVIRSLDIGEGTGPVAVELHFSNLRIHGFKNVKVPGPVKTNFDNFEFIAPVQLGDITIESDYKVKGKVMVLPVNGEGNCTLFLAKPTAVATFKGKPFTKKNVTYLDVYDFNFVFDTNKFTMNFNNLFNGNKMLSENMNVFLNENWKDILTELKPSIQEAFALSFKAVLNRIAHKVPYDVLFPK